MGLYTLRRESSESLHCLFLLSHSSQTGFQPHDWRGVRISSSQRGWKDSETTDLGYSRPGAVSVSDAELLPRGGWSPAGVRHHKVGMWNGWVGAQAAPLPCPPPSSAFLHSRETYNSLAAWLTDARTLASPNIVVILCGNKKDLDPEREVTFLEASRFAQENGEGHAVSPLGSWAFWLSMAVPSKGMGRFRGLGLNTSVATNVPCDPSGPQFPHLESRAHKVSASHPE